MNIWVLIFVIGLMGVISWQSMGICRRLKNQRRVAVANIAFWLSLTVAYSTALFAG